MGADDVSLYAMCRRWVQNAVDADAGARQPVPVRQYTMSVAFQPMSVPFQAISVHQFSMCLVHAGGSR